MQDMNYWNSMTNDAGSAMQNQMQNINSASLGAAQAMPGAQMQMAGQQNAMNNYAGIDYPAMSTSGASPSPQQNAAFAAPSAQAQPDSSSRGFNPWSLQGEANSR